MAKGLYLLVIHTNVELSELCILTLPSLRWPPLCVITTTSIHFRRCCCRKREVSDLIATLTEKDYIYSSNLCNNFKSNLHSV